MSIAFPNPDDILSFTLTIDPDEGMYKSGRFVFTFNIGVNFPHDPPKVKCVQKIYHPNIDLEGNVCLNILREDWKPVLNLNAVFVGLQVSLLLLLLGWARVLWDGIRWYRWYRMVQGDMGWYGMVWETLEYGDAVESLDHKRQHIGRRGTATEDHADMMYSSSSSSQTPPTR
jgi:hypothetical protein